MVKPLLEQLRTKVENAHGLSDTTKVELFKLVTDLEHQTAGHPTHPAEHQHVVDRLTEIVEELEISHPDITSLANRIATVLGNVGI